MTDGPAELNEPDLWRTQEGDVVELTVPALTDYLGVVRTATAGLAARLGFSLDEIEDLRIAVDEACVMLLSLPGPELRAEPTLTCRFQIGPNALAVRVSAPTAENARLPSASSFAWQVLIAHASELVSASANGLASIELTKPRTHR